MNQIVRLKPDFDKTHFEMNKAELATNINLAEHGHSQNKITQG